MEVIEGEGRSEIEFTEIVTAASCLDGSVIFHVVNDILGFVLFMHQQIPSILQDLSLEFDGLQTECKELEIVLAQTEGKASLRRLHAGRIREVKRVIKRLEKLMKTVSSLRASLQTMISEIPDIQQVMLILGANPIRPQHVYEVCFSHGKVVSGGAGDFTKTRVAEGLARKAIRALVSKGAGSNSYAGPSKLFLLVKAPSSLNMPSHFLPKRDFKYRKKMIPFKLRIKCKTRDQESDGKNYVAQAADTISLMDHSSKDLIWFQCRHVIKGIASRTSSVED